MTGIGELALRDQYGIPGGLSDDGDGIQIAIVVSAKRLRRIKPWEQAIRKYDQDLALVRVADVPRTSPTEFDTVATKLKKRLPEDLNVLIDLEGLWVDAFDLDSSVPNVLIFDRKGELLASHSGMYKRSLFEALRADLDQFSGSGPAQSP